MAHVMASFLLRVLALALLAVAFGAAAAQGVRPDTVAERRVKAAYVYRFAGYAQWPGDVFAARDAPLLIGVWAHDELADDLTLLVADRTVDGRRIEVRRIRDTDNPAGLHVLFVGRDRTARLAEATGSAPLRGTLVVTESPGALKQGGVINLLLSDGQVRFELSLEAAERHGLKLSSRLVAVSRRAQDGAR